LSNLEFLEFLLDIYKNHNFFEISIKGDFVNIHKLDRTSFNSLLEAYTKRYKLRLINHRDKKIYLFKTPRTIKILILKNKH